MRLGKGQKAGRRRRLSSPASTPLSRTAHAAEEVVAALLQECAGGRSRRPAHGLRAKSCGPPWRGKRSR